MFVSQPITRPGYSRRYGVMSVKCAEYVNELGVCWPCSECTMKRLYYFANIAVLAMCLSGLIVGRSRYFVSEGVEFAVKSDRKCEVFGT